MKIAQVYFEVLSRKSKVMIINDRKFAEDLRNQSHAEIKEVIDKKNVIYEVYK